MGALHTGPLFKHERVKIKTSIQVILARVTTGIKLRLKHPIKMEITKHPIASCSQKENTTKNTDLIIID